MTSFNDISCIVRSVGERTTDLCVTLLEKAFGTGMTCTVIEAQPFPEALRQSLNAGLAMGRPWTFVVDADVLVSSHALALLPSQADQMPAKGFMLHASVWDRFFGRYRRAGNRLYRTEFMQQALSLVPQNGTSMRPERDMCFGMKGMGYRIFKTFHIIGLHDYEQYYLDILRKGVLLRLKNAKRVAYLKEVWQSRLQEADYQAMIAGFDAAPDNQTSVCIDKNLINYCSSNTIAHWQNMEKPPIQTGVWSDEHITQMMKSDMARYSITPTGDTSLWEYA